ncbi:hypothetical protein [Streptomyces sp. SID14515]|uniref:hypothetical protein n=1 Tax=Streptomyces sp. SID14515 TaxID=2706074 RepID=UPI0013C90B0A|nr:hypothetical protein [Streptomyces sp. SID14515]NEB42338.1 hypothetical protein [Streptomyces sp. SID14515]
MGPIQIAEARARQSDDPRLYMLAYSAGWNAAADGGDLDGYARKVGLDGEAGFIEGAAAYRTKKATARDFVPGSPAHVQHIRGSRNV